MNYSIPEISIIMPSYNKAAFIEKSISSIQKQTFQNWELIILDDCSTDESPEILRNLSDQDSRIVFRENEVNLGMAANRNRALEMVRGKYIALLDADDIAPSYRLEREKDYLDQHPKIDVVFGNYKEIDADDKVKELYFEVLKNPDFVKANLMIKDVIPNGSAMYRRDFVNRYSIRYQDGMLGMDDYRFWVECSLHGRLAGIDECLLYWRNTPGNGTNTYLHKEENAKKRALKYNEIREYALKGNGFSLTGEEKKIYFHVLTEEKHYIADRTELDQFYRVIRKLCKQADEKENAGAIRLAFRRQFGRALENSYLWES